MLSIGASGPAGLTTTAAACVVLALAVGTFPGCPASRRLAALHRRSGRARAARALPIAVTAAVGVLAGLLGLGPAGAVVGGGAAVAWRRSRERARRGRAASATTAALADALDRITEEVRAGAHPAAALRGAAGGPEPAGSVLRSAAVAAELGHGVAASFTAEATARPEIARGLRHVAGAWTLAERHGVPLADLLGAVHADLRWRLAYTGRVSAALAGPKATAMVLGGLPVLGIVLGELIGAGPLQVLRSGVLGQMLVVTGAVLAAAGAAWARTIMSSAVPR
jgi:tight adherence protein B